MAAIRSFAAGSAVLGLALACAWVAGRQLDLPVMFVDSASGQCVAVLSPDPEHSCHNLPARYVREWTAPGAAAVAANEMVIPADHRRPWPENIDVDGAPRGLYGKEGRALEDDPEPLIIREPLEAPPADETREVVAAAVATASGPEFWFQDGDTFAYWGGGHGTALAPPTDPIPVSEPASVWLVACGAGALVLRRFVHGR